MFAFNIMQSDIITHVQDAVRPGEAVDMYYSNQENSVKQAHPTTVENRYFLNLQSTNFGSANTLIFNPDEGVDHLVLTLQLPAPGANAAAVNYQGLALNAGWGYEAIRRVGVRYGGSTLYYFSGDQMLIDILSECEDSQKKQDIFNLGGATCLGTAAGSGTFANLANRTAYVYIKLPHNTPSAQEANLPLPTDLLTSPVQVNIEFKQASEIFISNSLGGAGASALPTAFSVATAQFKQIHFDDRGEQLARKVNMSEMAYSYPLKSFSQEVFRIQNVQGGSDQTLTLTGLRSGNCLGVRVWCSPTGATDAWNYVVPNGISLSVNGLIYFDSRNGQQQLWNLLDRKSSASWTADAITVAGGTAFQSTPTTAYWTWIPFAQHSEVLAGETELSHGLSLMNSIVNLTVNLPNPGGQTPTTYTITAEYLFNSTLLFSRGSCEYVF